ncbi:hypothetical protein B0H13DRAFT_2123628 [Mycena leptocephala]|nr:hypothetical protein B0H13DRAFT_2123628 [Mycena leptocephala]
MSTVCTSSATATTESVTTMWYNDFSESLSTEPPTTTTITSETYLTLFGRHYCYTSAANNVTSPLSLPVSISTPTQSPSFAVVNYTIKRQVSMVQETITTTPPPSTIYVSPSGAPTGHVAQDNNVVLRIHSSYCGGVLAGFFGLLGIVLIETKRRWTISSIKKTRHNPHRGRTIKRFSLDAEMSLNLISMVSLGRQIPSLASLRRALPRVQPSSTCLNTTSPPPSPTSASSPGPSATTLSSRPSTAGSMRPLRDTRDPPGSSTSVHVSPAIPSHWGTIAPVRARNITLERSGSPTSVRDYEPQRRLQLANGRHVRLGSGGPGVLVHIDAGPAPQP